MGVFPCHLLRRWLLTLFYKPPAQGGPSEGRILNKDDQYLGDPDRSYYLRLDWLGDDNYKFDWAVYGADGTANGISYETALNPDTWYHIAGIYDGTVHQFYFNGELIEEQTVSVSRRSGNAPLYIGRLNYGGEFLSGCVDDIYIYNRSLSSIEIDSLYHLGGWPSVDCYQETATEPTACGGVGGGSYSEDGYWNDGIWDENYTIVDNEGLFVEYIKPPYAIGAILTDDRYIWNNSHGIEENEIPLECWDAGDTIKIWIHQIHSPEDSRCGPAGQYCLYIDCFDGSSWENRVGGSGSVSSADHFNKIYEEGITWILEETVEVEDKVNIGNISANQSSLILLPVNVDFNPDSTYRAAELNFSGYTDGLEFIGIDTVGTMIGGLDWAWAENEVDGVLQTAFAGSAGIAGEGVLCYLEFLVTGDICTIVPLNCEYALVNTREVTNITNGSVYITPLPFYGDIDTNGVVQAFDAALAMQHSIGDIELLCQQLYNGDVNLDNTVNAMDASLILGFVVDSIDSLPLQPDEPAFLASGNIWLEEVGAINGEPLAIPLNLEDGANIYSFEGEFSYDSGKFSFVEIVAEYDDFILEFREPELGHVKFAAYRPHDEGPTSGLFANIVFEDVSLETGEETILEMTRFKLNHNRHFDVDFVSIVSSEEIAVLPKAFTLNQNYPNPFNPITTISYALPEAADVSLVIYDVTGREVNRLVQTYQPAGWYEVEWNGLNSKGSSLSTGIYFARIETGSYSDVIKMVYLQ